MGKHPSAIPIGIAKGVSPFYRMDIYIHILLLDSVINAMCTYAYFSLLLIHTTMSGSYAGRVRRVSVKPPFLSLVSNRKRAYSAIYHKNNVRFRKYAHVQPMAKVVSVAKHLPFWPRLYRSVSK